MPAMSTLGGTPFTPGLRRAAPSSEFADETPKLGFYNAAFSGTPIKWDCLNLPIVHVFRDSELYFCVLI